MLFICNMTYFGLHGSLEAAEGKGDALANLLLQAAALVGQMEGCKLYLISREEAAANRIWITEAWDSQEAHDQSLKNPDVLALIGQAMPLLGEKPQGGQKLSILGGFGV